MYCFTVDDNIRCLKELTRGDFAHLLEHPYLAVYKRLHDEFGLKVQLNLFYRDDEFDLSQMTERFYGEWVENADWLKLSFHSDWENENPYANAPYDEVYHDCKRVHDEIVRFASPKALAETTTVHFCRTTPQGTQALADNGVRGLLGLFGSDEEPRVSYSLEETVAKRLRRGECLLVDGTCFAGIDIVLNCFSKEEILAKLEALNGRKTIRVMIHEQYYYTDYVAYQPDFEEKLRATFAFLQEHGYESRFFEEELHEARV